MNYGEIARWSVVASSIAFALVLIWGFRKLAVPAIAASNEAKNQEIAQTEKRLAGMKAQVEELKGNLASADSDASAIRARGEEQAEREREAALAEAKAAGERALRSAEGELERARIAAREQLRDEFASKALHSARTQAAQKASPVVNQQLVGRFIESIDHGGLN
ncbi:MAG: hypothetical protein ABR584_03575 [Candidatus Baltobacteraceae bacterium]